MLGKPKTFLNNIQISYLFKLLATLQKLFYLKEIVKIKC